jgi:hypothetical protein
MNMDSVLEQGTEGSVTLVDDESDIFEFFRMHEATEEPEQLYSAPLDHFTPISEMSTTLYPPVTESMAAIATPHYGLPRNALAADHGMVSTLCISWPYQ